MPASTGDGGVRRRWRFVSAVSAALVFALLFAQFAPGSTAAVRTREPFTGQGLDDLDARPGRVAPTTGQLEAVRRLGATARWTRFGTVSSLIRYRGALGKASSADAVTAARRWVLQHRELFRLSRAAVSRLALVADAETAGGAGHAVLLEQRFGTLPAGFDGMITVAVARGRIWYVSSSATGDAAPAAPATLTPVQGWLRAAHAVGEHVRAGDLRVVGAAKGWLTLDLPAFRFRQYVRPVALPIPGHGVVPAYETIVAHVGTELAAYTQFVDARTGKVWVRQNNVDQESDTPSPPRAADDVAANLSAALINLPEPTWLFFKGSPPIDYTTRDTRVLGCWDRRKVRGCGMEVANDAARAPWDQNVRLDLPWFTTMGNAAWTAQAWLNPEAPGEGYRPIALDRSYAYSWTNQWRATRCNPASFLTAQRVDVDAATANLFAFHNLMHDWAYHLGFTEKNWNLQDDNFGNTTPGPFPIGGEMDVELGDVQAGALTGGPLAMGLGRDNANQATFPDGIPGVTNQYLFQPLPGSFYTPCVDGDFDFGVVGHEYTHAISNRM
ncbi:MAG TPA: M36 family metallopeptidase, partial [Actinomycetota bacterium]|nr:M36 family metallopeptidase [Actinomycetota bacterium]